MAQSLNPQQREALRYIEGPLLVLAGAGSGKTSVITQKIAYLIDTCEISARHIAAVTFTNKAAREMKARISALMPAHRTRGLTVSTFHNLGLTIIRSESRMLGFKPGFSILDQEDCRNLIKELLQRHTELDDKLIDLAQSTISNWKSSLLSPIEAQNAAASDGEKTLANLYQRYFKALRAYNAVDFDDLLMIPVQLFNEHADVLEQWQQRIRYLLVDEYQDTNRAQYELVRCLVRQRQALTVVGDDDQSIYAWRGARPENLVQLQQDFNDLKVIKLEQNYRSTGRILRAANTLIENNPHTITKALWSELGPGDPLRLICTENESMECERVANEIIDMRLKRRCKYSDFAILYRSNYQARMLEIHLQKQDIAYEITGGQSFYAKTEIKDTMAYLRLVINPDDDNALLRIINTPRRQIGPTTLEQLGTYANLRELPLFQCIDEIGLANKISDAALIRLRRFKDWIEQIKRRLYSDEPISVIREMLEDADYLGWLHQNASSEKMAMRRWQNIDFLLEQLQQVLSKEDSESGQSERAVENAIAKLVLRDLLDREEQEASHDKVQLMTLHAAKGLEFLHVFMVGMEEDILPHKNSTEAAQIEEERRLTYVGITRAQRTLTMTRALQRTQYGNTTATVPSRFIDELPASDLVRLGEGTAPNPENLAQQRSASLAALKTLFD